VKSLGYQKKILNIFNSLTVRPTLNQVPRSNFLGINLDWFEANWIFELDYTLIPSLILGCPNQELSFYDCFWVQTNWFSLQNRCHVGLLEQPFFLANYIYIYIYIYILPLEIKCFFKFSITIIWKKINLKNPYLYTLLQFVTKKIWKGV
jgi:hypothetical protein